MRAQLIGLVRLLRPLNVVMFFAGVALGALLAGGATAFAGASLTKVLLAMASGALVGGGANAINDVYDLEIDRVNRPGRPLPSGLIAPKTARAVWLAASVLGIVLGMLVSLAHGLLALAVVLLLWAYSAHLKRLPGVGNLVVALVLGLAILYGGVAVSVASGPLLTVGILFAVATTLAREMVKDVEDAQGDAAEGARTLPLVWGVPFTVRLVLFVLAATLIGLPLAALVVGTSAFLAYALPAAGAVLAAAWPLLVAEADAWHYAVARSSAWLKATMVLGIVALALTRLG